ncbi:hypothetical protein V5799_017008 [Amblyomma americanum]|uniref:Transmembrane protein n=1 Tax=Amblyomma americanum TaxID=6943 RepID=A0AAQ4EA75_AMBAM
MAHRTEGFKQWQPSWRSCYDDFEDRYFDDVADRQYFYKFDEDDDHNICLPPRQHSSSKRPDHRATQSVVTKKQEEVRILNPSSEPASGIKVLKRVASGWAELLPTVCEHPTMEQAEQDAQRSLTRLKTCNTSTLTHGMCTAGDTCSSTRTMQPPATATVCASKEILAICHPQDMSEPVPLPEASITPSLTKDIVGRESKESCRISMAQAEQVGPVDAVEDKEAVPTSHNTFSTPPRVFFGKVLSALSTCREKLATKDVLARMSTIRRMFTPRVFLDKVLSALSTCREKLAAKAVLARISTIPRKFAYGAPAAVPETTLLDEEGLVPCVNLPYSETVQGPGRVPAAFTEFVDVDGVVHPDRGCVLILVVGLMVTMFVLASVLTARSSFRMGALSDQTSYQAVNAEAAVNTTNFGMQMHSSCVDDTATAARREADVVETSDL